MIETILSDPGQPSVILRPLRRDMIGRAGQLIAGMRDARADGLPQEHEEGFWSMRANTCISTGGALELNVNGGAPVGVALALPDSMSTDRAIFYACEIVDGYEQFRAPMMDALRAWAKAQKRDLGRVEVVRKWVSL